MNAPLFRDHVAAPLRWTAVVSLAVFTLISTGCGGTPAPSSPQAPRNAPDTATPSGESAKRPVPAASPSLSGISLRIEPSRPSRLLRPHLVLGGVPPGVNPSFESVVWTVNGSEQKGSGVLEPSEFRKGDRIGASAVLRIGDSVLDLRAGEVVVGNTLPTIRSVKIEPQRLLAGGTAKAIVDVVDRDEDPIRNRYRWFVDEKEVPGDGETMSLEGVRKRSVVRVVATSADAEGATPPKSSPGYAIANSTPVIRSVPPADAEPGKPFTYSIVAGDPDGDPLTVRLRKGPPGMTLSGDTLRWEMPAELQGAAEVEVEVSDGDGGVALQSFRMSIGR